MSDFHCLLLPCVCECVGQSWAIYLFVSQDKGLHCSLAVHYTVTKKGRRWELCVPRLELRCRYINVSNTTFNLSLKMFKICSHVNTNKNKTKTFLVIYVWGFHYYACVISRVWSYWPVSSHKFGIAIVNSCLLFGLGNCIDSVRGHSHASRLINTATLRKTGGKYLMCTCGGVCVCVCSHLHLMLTAYCKEKKI